MLTMPEPHPATYLMMKNNVTERKSDQKSGQKVDLEKKLTRATLLEQEQLRLEAEVWGSCTIQDGGTGSVPS